MARIAFIGLGTMGVRIAPHLFKAGHELVGYDLDPACVEASGLPWAASPSSAIAGAEVAFTSLPGPEAVREVWLGEHGLAAGARPGTLLIDLSTGPPGLARELAAELEPRGLAVLDAPVSGGPRGADDATLTVMVGGREEPFAQALPLFEAFGRHVTLVGPHGAGQVAKLCNNLAAGVTMVALAEACAIAEREGLDAATLFAVLTSSTGDSRVARTRFPLAGADPAHPASRGWETLFALDLMAKDLDLAIALGEGHGISAASAEAALSAYRAAQAAGDGGLDYSAVIRALQTRADG